MNLKKFSGLFKFCIFLLLFSFCSGGEAIVKEIGTFPTIEGNNLNKVSKKVPDDFVERDLIVILAFQQWHQPLVDETIESLESNDLDERYNIIEVPTIGPFNKLGQMYLDGTMRAAIRDDFVRDRTITVYLNKEELRNALDIPNEDTIYWFMVKKGSSSILLRGEGVISESEIEDLKDLP